MKFSSSIALAAFSYLAYAAPVVKEGADGAAFPTGVFPHHGHFPTGTGFPFPTGTGFPTDPAEIEKLRKIYNEFFHDELHHHPHGTGTGGSPLPTGFFKRDAEAHAAFPTGVFPHHPHPSGGFPFPSGGFKKDDEFDEAFAALPTGFSHHPHPSGGFPFPSGGFPHAKRDAAFPTGVFPHHPHPSGGFPFPSGGFPHVKRDGEFGEAHAAFPTGTFPHHAHPSGGFPHGFKEGESKEGFAFSSGTGTFPHFPSGTGGFGHGHGFPHA